MKQYQLTHGGGIDDLLLEEHEIPRPGPHEVLVHMRAASLNYRDLLIVTGRYPRNQQNSIVPLSDGAGEIVEVGTQVTRWRATDRVAGIFMQSWLHGTMRDGDGDSALGGDATEWDLRYGASSAIVYRFYGRLGFGVRLTDEGRVMEIIVAQIPYAAVVKN